MNNTKSTFAVVTTVADDPINVEIFVRYHLEIGAEKVFVFLDDNNMVSFQGLQHIKNVKVFLRTPELMDSWKLISLHERSIISKDASREVMYRQCMNFGVAATYARLEGIDWLLHLDGDELFYPNGADLTDFFHSLKLGGVGACRFLNYECIPQREEAGHHFEECNVFKVNDFKYIGYEEAVFDYSDEKRKFIEATPWLKSMFFNFYFNGKSATNLNEKFQIIGVHCSVPDNKNIHTAGKRDPLILHYPCASFRAYKDKYKRLGDFIEYPFSDSLHIESKRLFLRGNEDQAKRYYDSYMALDPTKIIALKKVGLVTTIEGVVDTIGKIKNSLITEKMDLVPYKKNIYSAKSKGAIYKFDIASEVDDNKLFLSFSSAEKARGWARRMLPKGLFSECEVIFSHESCFFIKINGSYAIDLSESDNVEWLAEKIISIGVEDVCFIGVHNLYTRDYAGFNSINIESDRYRKLKKLSEYIKDNAPEISLSLEQYPQSPMIIPLMHEGLITPRLDVFC